MKKFRIVALAGFALSLTAQVASAENLFDALLEAYRQNPTLNAARAGQRATDEAVPQALSGWRPTVSASGTAGQTWSNTYAYGSNTNSSVTPTTENLSIKLDQPLFRGFKTVEGTAAAEAQVKAGQQQLLSTEQAVLLNGVQAYLDVIRDRRTVQLRQQNLVVLNDQLKASDARFKAGELTKTDVAQSRSGVATAQAALAGTLAQLRASEANFVEFIGHQPQKLDSAPAARAPASLDQAFEIAHETNPQILAAAQAVDFNEHNVGVARAGLLPTADLQGLYGFTATQNGAGSLGSVVTTDSSALTVQGVVNVPIYEAGLVYSQVRAAKQRASQSRIAVIDTTRQVRQAVAANWAAYTSTKQAVQSSATSVSASQTAYDGVKQEYQVGSRSTIDVLNAEQTLLSAQISAVALQHDLILASYKLQASIGHLTGRHLHLGPLYDSTQNYKNVRNQWIGTKADVLQ